MGIGGSADDCWALVQAFPPSQQLQDAGCREGPRPLRNEWFHPCDYLALRCTRGHCPRLCSKPSTIVAGRSSRRVGQQCNTPVAGVSTALSLVENRLNV